MTKRVEQIWEFVESVHEGQLYANKPYREGHLDGVVAILAEAGMSSESDIIIGAAHDAIEDAKDERHRQFVFEWLRHHLSDFEFQAIWALTGLGENRKARNADAKAKIKAFPASANYKLADRIFNWEQAVLHGKPQASMYQREDAEFFETVVALADNEYLIDRYRRLSGRV